jgi:hypothetical protein
MACFMRSLQIIDGNQVSPVARLAIALLVTTRRRAMRAKRCQEINMTIANPTRGTEISKNISHCTFATESWALRTAKARNALVDASI